jgi:hypothetical protein
VGAPIPTALSVPQRLQAIRHDGAQQNNKSGNVDAAIKIGEQQGDASNCCERQQGHSAHRERYAKRAVMVRHAIP